MKKTLVTANVHVNDDTQLIAEKVTNFVSLSLGDVNLFLMNSGQASRLVKAAKDAFDILNEMEGNPASTDEMLKAGKAYINDIYRGVSGGFPDGAKEFNATLGWDLEDWQVVMKRHGSFIPSQKDVDKFHVKFKKGLK